MTEHGPGTNDASGDAPDPTEKTRKRKGKKGRPPKKRRPRPTDAIVQARVLDVMQWLVEGNRRRHIMQLVAESKEKARWGNTPVRTVDEYIARATAELSKIADEPRNTAKSKARARYELVIRKATIAEQWEVVRKANRDLARLDGLEPRVHRVDPGSAPIEHNHTGTITHEHEATVTHHTAGSIEDRANRVTDILALATQRRLAAHTAATNN